MSIHTVGWPVSASEVQSLGFFFLIWNVFLFAFWSFDIISLYIISGYHFWYVLNLEIRQPKITKDFFATNPIFLIWMADGLHRFMGTAPQFSSHRCVKKSTARRNWTLQVQPQHLGGWSDEQNSEGITSSPAVIALGVEGFLLAIFLRGIFWYPIKLLWMIQTCSTKRARLTDFSRCANNCYRQKSSYSMIQIARTYIVYIAYIDGYN